MTINNEPRTTQEVHHLILRLASMANPPEGIFDGPGADMHLQGYTAQGWRVHTVMPGAIDQSTSAMVVFYLLVRDVPVQDVTMGYMTETEPESEPAAI